MKEGDYFCASNALRMRAAVSAITSEDNWSFGLRKSISPSDCRGMRWMWAFEGLQRLVANNFKFTESDRIRENREAVKRDNNNIFDFMESEGYIRRKADASISSKDFYEIYRMWCEENSLAPLKARSFSDAMIANAGRFNLEHCNNITNSAGRRVWGFMGVEAVARPHINGFYGDSPCTYVPEDIPEEWRQVE